MKTSTQNSIKTSSNLKCFFGTILTIALTIPSIAVSQSSPEPVDLGISDNFVILAKSGISTTGTTSIVGNIGVSPIDHTAITGFTLILDPSGQFATSTLVDGKIFSADYASPTPTMMTTAVSNMETAYTDAAGRIPDYTELYGGDLTGQTLTTGVYKWSTGVLVSAGGMTISGSPTDVWIFEIAQNLTLANGAIINLTGGAQATNIFWQVAGEATLGTTSDFSGVILCQTLIAMQTGAAFNGRALAQNAITLDANSVGISLLSLNDQNLKDDIAMYPNPAQGDVTIANAHNSKLDNLSIYDLHGRLINSIDLSDMQDERTIDVSNLSSGVYIVQIKGEGTSTIKRLIKR